MLTKGTIWEILAERFSALLGASVAILVVQKLAIKPELVAFLVGAIAGAFTTSILRTVTVELPSRNKFIRKRLDRRSWFEGIWAQVMRDGQGAVQQVTIVTIIYSPNTDSFGITGVVRESEGILRGAFQAETSGLIFSTENLSLEFVWRGQSQSNSNEYYSCQSSGTTLILLQKDSDVEPHRGTSHITHTSRPGVAQADLYRITQKLLETIGIKERWNTANPKQQEQFVTELVKYLAID